jgi:sec-independent protein translocase protein TatC
MGDDSEPHGSRPDHTDDSADTDAVVEAEPPADVDREERPKSASDADDPEHADESAAVDTNDRADAADPAASGDAERDSTDADASPTTNTSASNAHHEHTDTDETAVDADADVDGGADDGGVSGPDDIDWTTYATDDRDEDGVPNPTPPPGDLAVDDTSDTSDTHSDESPADGQVDVDGAIERATESDSGEPESAADTDSGAEDGSASDEETARNNADFDFSHSDTRDVATSEGSDAADTTDTDDVDEEDGTALSATEDEAGASTAEPVTDAVDAPAAEPVIGPEEAPPETGDARDAPPTGAEVVADDPAYDPALADDDDFDGPESDVEMPLADHIEEMVRRLGIVFLIAGVVGVVVFPIADDLVNFLWNTHIPGATTIESRRPRLYGPLELILTELKVAGLAGFVVGLPVFVYQTYRFMRPGLYPRERKYYLAAVPTSLILAFIGVAFAHFVVLPAIFAYFTSYTIGTAVIAFGLKETFGLILVLMGYMALVFQIPLFIMLAIMMDLVTRQWLTEKRLLFWGGFLGLSFLVSPDPTGMAPIIIAATMITLFEGTLLLLRWVNR